MMHHLHVLSVLNMLRPLLPILFLDRPLLLGLLYFLQFFEVSFESYLLTFCSDVSDAGDHDNEEEGSKLMGKRQYVCASSLFFFWV